MITPHAAQSAPCRPGRIHWTTTGDGEHRQERPDDQGRPKVIGACQTADRRDLGVAIGTKHCAASKRTGAERHVSGNDRRPNHDCDGCEEEPGEGQTSGDRHHLQTACCERDVPDLLGLLGARPERSTTCRHTLRIEVMIRASRPLAASGEWSLLAEVESNLVAQRVGEVNLGASVEGIYPEEQLGGASWISRLGFVDADSQAVAYSEAADVASLFEHHGKTQSRGVELSDIVERVSRHVERDVVEVGHAPTLAGPARAVRTAPARSAPAGV
jgi:hypothetical protein